MRDERIAAKQKKAIEQIIKSSALWGAEMNKIGHEKPIPIIEWDEDRVRVTGIQLDT